MKGHIWSTTAEQLKFSDLFSSGIGFIGQTSAKVWE